jgi:hypothetical protein
VGFSSEVAAYPFLMLDLHQLATTSFARRARVIRVPFLMNTIFFNHFNHAENSNDNPQISQIQVDILYLWTLI